MLLSTEERGAVEESPFLFLLLSPPCEDFLDLVGPLDLSSATVAELVAQEYFPFATFAEEPFLLLKILCHGDSVGPRFSGKRVEK